MKRMRSSLLLLLCLCGISLAAQENEWNRLMGLLQKEATFFEGRKGFIQLGKSEYNTFSMEKVTVTDSLVVFGMRLQDRFGNEGSEQYLEEFTVFYSPETEIVSAELYYGHSYYFSDFPDSQFLLLEFDERFPMIQKTVSVYKDLKTGQTDRSEMEQTTDQIIFPIRRKNRAAIFKAIDQYQLKSLKSRLDDDRTH